MNISATTVVSTQYALGLTYSPLKGQCLMSDDKKNADDTGVDDLIDQNIRLLYNGLIEEGLPDRFKDLLAMIRAEDHLRDQGQDE